MRGLDVKPWRGCSELGIGFEREKLRRCMGVAKIGNLFSRSRQQGGRCPELGIGFERVTGVPR